jgi:peptidoglycan/xylan/chitin deacetylase (PgdA/CDA1 family)
MKRLLTLSLLLSLPLTFSSCSAGALAPARTLSSAHDDVALDSFLASPDPRGMAKNYVLRLLRIRLRAQAWLREFDATLSSKEETVDIFAVPAYQKLLMARPLSERAEAKIVEIYKDAREVSLEAGVGTGAEKKLRSDRAMLVVAGVRDALRDMRKSKAQRVLMHDLLEAMKATFKEEAASAQMEDLTGAFHANALGEAAQEAAPDIGRMIEELPETDEVKEEVEAEAARFEEERKIEARQPSGAAKAPGTGPNGNVMGFEFPTSTYALTFDDGPHQTFTMQMLGNLQATGAKGSFFWITNNARRRAPIVKAVQNARMTVANHSYMHAKILVPKDLARLNTTQEKEIVTSTEEFTKIYGFKPRFFRLPYAQGMTDNHVRSMIANLGMIHVKWNIDSADWDDKNPVTVLARVEAQMRQNGRGIILFHDVHPQSVAASHALMQKYRGKVRWVTIDEIVDELNSK